MINLAMKMLIIYSAHKQLISLGSVCSSHMQLWIWVPQLHLANLVQWNDPSSDCSHAGSAWHLRLSSASQQLSRMWTLTLKQESEAAWMSVWQWGTWLMHPPSPPAPGPTRKCNWYAWL
jgi:hypothetical protein